MIEYQKLKDRYEALEETNEYQNDAICRLQKQIEKMKCCESRKMMLETISKAIRLNLKQGKTIKCIHITKEDLEQIKQENIFIQPEVINLEIDKTTLFGYPVKEDFMTFIE